MTCRTPAWPSTRASTSSRRTSCVRCSSAWAPTAPSARTRTRRRSWPSDPDRHAQGYFVYDSKKSGSYTISHLRFGPRPIRAPYLLKSANFVGIHKFDFLYKLDTLAAAAPGATVLINSPYAPDDRLERAPARGAAADRRQEAQAPRHRCVRRGVRPRPGLAREHHPADVLLRAVGRDAPRQGHRGDQARDGKNVCEEGEGDRPEELCRDRQRHGEPARGSRSGEGDGPAHPPRRSSRIRRRTSCAT